MSKRTRTLLLVAVLLVAAVTLSGCGVPQGDVYNNPQGLWNTLVSWLAHALDELNTVIAGLGVGGSWGWAIIVFTIIIKLVTLPLTFKQLQSTKMQQQLQPKMTELQQKYGKDRQKLAEEQMKLYKEAGFNPAGGCLPLLIQMPILFALYQSLYVLASASVGKLTGANFLWIPDLAIPSLSDVRFQDIDFKGMGWLGGAYNAHRYDLLVAYLSLPVIMIVSQLILQKMTQPATGGKPKTGQPDQTQMMGQMMMFMPIMFGYITLGLPSGLTLYWTVSNILQLIQQYFITGWGGLSDWIAALKPKPKPVLVQTVGDTATSDPDAPKLKRRRRRK